MGDPMRGIRQENSSGDVHIREVAKRFGTTAAVNKVSIDVQNGEFLTFLGPSGCGKTTLLRMVAGFLTPDAGEIYFGQALMNSVPPWKRNVGFVFQNYALWPHMTAGENIAYGLKIRKLSRREIREKVREVLELVGLPDIETRYPSQLSGGQQQRIALARVLVLNPGVLLMDEPLSNLDVKLRGQMRAELSRLHIRLKTTTIYVTHDQMEAMTMSDRIVVMRDGLVQQIGAPLEIYDKPDNVFVGGFIGTPPMNFVDAVLAKEGDAFFVQGKGFKLRVPEGKFKDLGPYLGKEVIFGIRPEDIIDQDFYSGEPGGNVITAMVDVTEPLGSEVLLHGRFGEASIVARVNPGTRARGGEEHLLLFNMQKMHLFHKETEKAIEVQEGFTVTDLGKVKQAEKRGFQG
ncbi:MAG: ABC transporter ATP-binding protein [Firmicutes bacterium]|nr:ABC transporter ATP-binding protein [Bacillota bacterium]